MSSTGWGDTDRDDPRLLPFFVVPTRTGPAREESSQVGGTNYIPFLLSRTTVRCIEGQDWRGKEWTVRELQVVQRKKDNLLFYDRLKFIILD